MTKVTKPILLDETGRAINETLERIRQTIDQRNKVDWGEIEGLLADQADLVAEFDKKENKHILLKHCDSTSGQEVLAEVFDVVSEHVGQGFRWAYEGGEDRIYPTLFVMGNPTSVAFAYTETRLIDDSYVTEVVIAKITLVDGLYQYEEQRTELLSKGVAEGRFVDFSTEQIIQAAKTFKSGLNLSNTRIRNVKSPQETNDAATKGYVDSVGTRVTTVEGKIPAQASADNQLADKAFVNSSIATNTANFIGTFNSLEELEEYPTTDLTNNDYAFVIGSDGEGNVQYSRYKWMGTGWLFEYVLNNSSFTGAQWATINSGLTGNDVTALRSALTLIGNVVPADASGANKLVTRQYMEDRHIILPLLTLEATQEQLAGVYNAILNAPTGSAFFISLPEGRGIMPLATAIGGTSVFAQYADGRYSHELKITKNDETYLFSKTDNAFVVTEGENIIYAPCVFYGGVEFWGDVYFDIPLDMAGRRILDLADPIDATDAVTKRYLESQISTLPLKKGEGGDSVQQISSTATGNYAFAEGYKNIASGTYSHAEGAENDARGNGTHAEGHNTTAVGNNAHAEGFVTKAIGVASHAEGNRTVTNNIAEHAEGNYNASHAGATSKEQTLHSVGIGTSNSARKNAYEIMQNGDVYVIGLGGYDGTNAGQAGVKTLQQILQAITI